MRYSQSSVLSRNPFPSTYSDISGILVFGDHGITTDLADTDGVQRGPDTVNPSTVDIFDHELETDLAGSPDITQRVTLTMTAQSPTPTNVSLAHACLVNHLIGTGVDLYQIILHCHCYLYIYIHHSHI